MLLDQGMKRKQHRRARTDLIGQRRQAQLDAFAGIALTLPVQRLVLAELLEQHHGIAIMVARLLSSQPGQREGNDLL